jgi:hypothetical protein
MAVKAMKTRAKLLGQDHESTLSSINMVGLATLAIAFLGIPNWCPGIPI